jgi:copper chaperone CopZ
MIKKTYQVQGMDCESCAMMIEGELQEAGVKAHCSYPKQTLEVEFDEKNIDEKKITSVVASSGYSIIS